MSYPEVYKRVEEDRQAVTEISRIPDPSFGVGYIARSTS